MSTTRPVSHERVTDDHPAAVDVDEAGKHLGAGSGRPEDRDLDVGSPGRAGDHAVLPLDVTAGDDGVVVGEHPVGALARQRVAGQGRLRILRDLIQHGLHLGIEGHGG
jgi:hypothetical protein